MNIRSGLHYIFVLVNLAGAIVSVACWIGDMGWALIPVAGFFLTALVVGAAHADSDDSNYGVGDYCVTSLGWHLAVLGALGVGGWKLLVVGIGIGALFAVGVLSDSSEEESPESTDEAAAKPTASSAEKESDRASVERAQRKPRPKQSPKRSSEEFGPFTELISMLRDVGDSTPNGIDWDGAAEEHLGKVISATVYAGFIVGVLGEWPADADSDSTDGQRWHRRANTVGQLIWEWEQNVPVESCTHLHMAAETQLESSGEEGGLVFMKALEMCCIEDGQFRTVNGRFSLAADFLKLVAEFWADGMEKLKEDFPMGDGIDGDAASDGLAMYTDARSRAEVFVLQFIRNASIHPAEIAAGQVNEVLDCLLPASRKEFVKGWCGAAGYK